MQSESVVFARVCLRSNLVIRDARTRFLRAGNGSWRPLFVPARGNRGTKRRHFESRRACDSSHQAKLNLTRLIGI